MHSDTGGLIEAAAGFGRPFSSGDPDDLARVMVLAHGDAQPLLAPAMLHDWDWSGVVDDYLRLYDRLPRGR